MTEDYAVRAGDAIEADLTARIAEVYQKALERAIKNNAEYLKNVRELDARAEKLKAKGWDNKKIEAWRKEEMMKLLREQQVVQNIADEMNCAGIEIAPEIQASMVEIYKVNNDMTRQRLNETVTANFAMTLMPKRQMEIILNDTQPVFSKIAYQHLGQNETIRRRLQSEFAQATILGESQEKLVRRIMKVTGQAAYQARRVAQTERTRTQSQARHDAMHEAAQMGIIVIKEWACRMVNSRDSHIALHGTKIPEGEKFRSISGAELEYPGDPSAPASEVINCHCVLIPGVEMPEEKTAKVEQASGIGENATLRNALSEEEYAQYQRLIQNADESVQRMFAENAKDVAFADTEYKKSTAQYVPYQGIYANLKNVLANKPQTLYHEMAHNIDNILHLKKTFTGSGKYGGDAGIGYSYTYKRNRFGKALKQDVENALQNYKQEREKQYQALVEKTREEYYNPEAKAFYKLMGMTDEEIEADFKAAVSRNSYKAGVTPITSKQQLEKEFSESLKSTLSSESRGDLSDMLEAQMQYVSFPLGAGHGSLYWQQDECFAPMEAFAEMTSAQIANGESWEQIQKFFPESVKVYQEMLEGL